MAKKAKKKEDKAEQKEKAAGKETAGEKATGRKEKAIEKAGEKKPGEKADAKKGGEKPVKGREKPAARHTREKRPGVPDWVELKPQEAIEAITNLGNAGHNSSEIGMMLRDQYGVPNIKALCGKSVEHILAEHKLLPEIPSDLMNLIKKSVDLRKHLAKNRKDFTAKRGLQLTISKIRNLVKYYKGEGKLPMDWRYSEETAALLVK